MAVALIGAVLFGAVAHWAATSDRALMNEEDGTDHPEPPQERR
jgi:hypothetical protein